MCIHFWNTNLRLHLWRVCGLDLCDVWLLMKLHWKDVDFCFEVSAYEMKGMNNVWNGAAFPSDWTWPHSESVFHVFTVSPQSQWDQNQEGSGPAAEPHQVLPRTVQVRQKSCREMGSVAYILIKLTCFLFSFFQDGLKAVDNLKPSIEKLATDLHTVRKTSTLSPSFFRLSPFPLFSDHLHVGLAK